jgi:hypothetical protein
MPTINGTTTKNLKASLTKVVSKHSDVHAGLAHGAMDAAERQRQARERMAANAALTAPVPKGGTT